MIKSIIANPIGRRFVATTMLTTAVIGGDATKLCSAQNISTNVQTELINNNAAQALKANTISLESFSFERNRKLNKIYLKNCDIDRTQKNKKETIDAIYKVYGTYGATIELQNIIDSQFIESSINQYLEHFSFTDKTRAKAINLASEFYKWRDDVFFTELFADEQKMYEEQRFPSAEKAIEVIDNHINNDEFFSKQDKETYDKNSKWFLSEQKDKTSVQAKSDLLSFKVHLLNALAFNRYFIKNNMPEDVIFRYYFNDKFVNGENCIEP